MADAGDLQSPRCGATMSYREPQHLRVLIANERRDRLALVAPIVTALGHEVIAREIEVLAVGQVTARERPDVALVGLGQSSAHALALIEKIVQEAACPVILLIHAPDPDFVKEASKRGIRASRHHRAGQGHPHGTPLGRRHSRLRNATRPHTRR
jgi:chemotaxis response regulator CheB